MEHSTGGLSVQVNDIPDIESQVFPCRPIYKGSFLAIVVEVVSHLPKILLDLPHGGFKLKRNLLGHADATLPRDSEWDAILREVICNARVEMVPGMLDAPVLRFHNAPS
jgi:hypothetical protein